MTDCFKKCFETYFENCSCNCNDNEKRTIIDIIVFVILYFGLFPILFAIIKYKDKSYGGRYCLLWRSYWKPFICVALSGVFCFIIIFIFNDC